MTIWFDVPALIESPEFQKRPGSDLKHARICKQPSRGAWVGPFKKCFRAQCSIIFVPRDFKCGSPRRMFCSLKCFDTHWRQMLLRYFGGRSRRRRLRIGQFHPRKTPMSQVRLSQLTVAGQYLSEAYRRFKTPEAFSLLSVSRLGRDQ